MFFIVFAEVIVSTEKLFSVPDGKLKMFTFTFLEEKD